MCSAGRMSLDDPAQPMREKVSAMLLWEAGSCKLCMHLKNSVYIQEK